MATTKRVSNATSTSTSTHDVSCFYPYPGEVRPSERYRKQRKVQVKIVDPFKKEIAKMQKALVRVRNAQKKQERRDRQIKAARKNDGEFDEFLCETQVLEGWVSNIVDNTAASKKIIDATSHVEALADSVGATITNSMSSVKDFLNINTNRINTQCVLAAITVAKSRDFLTIILEILKLLNNYTDVLVDCMNGATSFIWNHIYTLVQWAQNTWNGDAYPVPSEGSITGVTPLEAQAGLESFVPDRAFWNTAGALAVGIGALFGSTLVLGNRPEVSQFAYKAFKRATENVAVKKLQNGIESFITVALDNIKKGMVALIPEGTFLPAIEEWFREERLDMSYYVSEVNTLIDPVNRDAVLYGDGAQEKLKELCGMAQLIEEAIMDKKLEPNNAQMGLVRTATRSLMDFAIKYQYAHTELVRDTPFVVCIFSEPGVGKSVMTSAFAHNICAPEHGCKVELNRENFIYYRSSADKYYTNYRGQPVFVVDDWAQCRAPSPENSEMRDFISMVSSVPWAPSQAGVDEKGRPYNSKLVIVTTNVPYPKPNEISDAGAIYRRRNFMLEMVVLDSKKHLPIEDHRRYGFYIHANDIKLRLNTHPLTFAQVIKSKIIPAFNSWDQKNQEIKQVGVVNLDEEEFVLCPEERPLTNAVSLLLQQNRAILLEDQGGVESNTRVQREDPILANYHQTWSRYRTRCSDAASYEHVEHVFKRDWRAGVREEINREYNFCKCCGSSACGVSLREAVCCVPNYSENVTHWGLVGYLDAWRFIEDYNDAWHGDSPDTFMYFCHDTTTLYHQTRDDITSHRLFETSTWEHDMELYTFFKLFWQSEYNDYCHDYTDMEFIEYLENTKPRRCLETQTGPTPDEMVALRKAKRCQNLRASIDQARAQRASRLAPLNRGTPVSWRADNEHVATWAHVTEPIATEEERAQAAAMLETARNSDEDSVLTAVFNSQTVPHSVKVALKAVTCFVLVFASIKAMKWVTGFFGTSRKAIEVVDSEGEIQKIIADFPPTLKTVAGDVLRVTIAELAGAAVGRVIRAEGGASAYGEALTVKAARRRNLKFATNIEKAVRMQVNESAPPEWLLEDQVNEMAQTQGCADNQGMDLIRHIVGPKNTLSLTREGETGGNRVCVKGLGVAGRLIIVPWHFMPAGFPVLETEICFGQRTVKMSIDYSKAKRGSIGSTLLDLAFIELDHSIECFKDIRKHFVRETDLKRLDKFKSTLILHQAEAGGFYITSNFIQSQAVTGKEGYKYEPSLPEPTHYDVLKGFKYHLPTQKGDCGAVLVALDSSLQGRICGMHVAGQKSLEIGISIPVTYELIEENIKQHFPNLYVSATTEANIIRDEPVEEAVEKATVLPEGEMEFVGRVLPEYSQRFPRKTDLKKSLLHDKVFQHTKEPSVLSGRDPRIKPEKTEEGYTSPMQSGVVKYAEPILPFNRQSSDLASAILLQEYSRFTPRGMSMRILTDAEMINGVPSAGYTAMDISTSPGMPYKTLRPPGSTGKHAFFKYDETSQTWEWDMDRKVSGGVNPASIVKHDMDMFVEAVETGKEIPFHFNYENLKQETLKIAKIEAGKTRLFSCAPLSINMLIRKYFGAMVVLQNQNCTECPSAVGINPLGYDWTRLAQRLLEKGDQHIAGDYQKWDGKVCGAIMASVVEEVVNPLYQNDPSWRKEDDMLRLALIDYCIHCPTLVGDTMLWTHIGLPSGVSITSDINSDVNTKYMIMAFIDLKRNHSCHNCRHVKVVDFFKYIAMTAYGDDHDLSVASDCTCFFTFNTVKRYFENKGIGYTDALKTGNDAPDFLPLSQVSYLKRLFVETDGLYKAPLDLESVKDQLNWVRDGGDPVEAVVQNADGVMREMFMHGRRQYEEAAQQVKTGLETLRSEMFERGEEGFAIPVWSFDEETRRWRDNIY